MGITINDSLALSIGITQANTYSSIGNNDVTISPSSTQSLDYDVRGFARVWIDKASRDLDRPIVHATNVSVGITKGQLDENLYTLLYTELKTQYTSTSDVMD